MNYSFKIIFVLSLAFGACKEELRTKTEIDPDSGFTTVYAVGKDGTTYHGPYTKSDSAGVLLEKGNFQEGELNGFREILFPDGKVKIRERYVNGKMADLYEYYFPNGNLELKGYYVEGAMYGPWKKYDDKGNLLEVVTMVNNEEMGPFVEYSAAGKIQAEGVYLHGPNEDGVLNLYDDDGELYKKMLCDSGVCITTWEKK
ncbi:MAG TPA: hypothetical protein VMZ69_02285 [Saprospiraceae bacterium]|nr:hypothetical protein [Saprospiraceae bacterium]